MRPRMRLGAAAGARAGSEGQDGGGPRRAEACLTLWVKLSSLLGVGTVLCGKSRQFGLNSFLGQGSSELFHGKTD